jgi:hypothetical protein
MAPIAPVLNPSVVRHVAQGTLDGQIVQNVTHWALVTGEWSMPAMIALAGAYAQWLSLHLSTVQSVDMQWTEARLTQLAGEEGLRYDSVYASAVPGDNEAGAFPNNVALCASVLTGFAGKSGRGRFYIPAIPTDAADQSRCTAPYITLVNAALLKLVDGSIFAGYQLGVYSTVSGGVPRETGLFRSASQVAARDNVLDSQRRRLPGRGR